MGILVEEVKPGLQRILEEGFVDTGRRFSYLYMLERGNDAILYDPKKDKVDFLNDMVVRNNGSPVVVMFKSKVRKEYEK